MSDPAGKKIVALRNRNLDLTQSIRRLTVPESTLTDIEQHLEERRTALLVCRDGEIRKWGRRWLERAGLNVAIVDDPAEYLVEDADPRKLVPPGNTFNAVISIESPSEAATGFKLNVCYRLTGGQLRCAIEDFK